MQGACTRPKLNGGPTVRLTSPLASRSRATSAASANSWSLVQCTDCMKAVKNSRSRASGPTHPRARPILRLRPFGKSTATAQS